VQYDSSLGNLHDTFSNPLGFNYVSSQVDVSRTDWNNLPSTFWLAKGSSGNVIAAGPLGSSIIAQVACAGIPTFPLYDCDMTFNTSKNWYNPATGFGVFKVDRAARHEFGHMVQFSDQDRVDTIMYRYYSDTIYAWVPQSTDGAEVTSIYG
jgi:hypothetical protein